jgi:hypothetical protein
MRSWENQPGERTWPGASAFGEFPKRNASKGRIKPFPVDVYGDVDVHVVVDGIEFLLPHLVEGILLDA